MIFMRLWQRLGWASIGDELHAARLVDYVDPEPLTKFVNAFAEALFVLVFRLLIFAHRLLIFPARPLRLLV